MPAADARLKVMIAGIGGASLGTELLKSLQLAGRYDVFGCDVSPTAYGMHDPGFARTYRADRRDYVASVLRACLDAGATYLIPGGEQPMVLLGAAAGEVAAAGIRLVGNNAEVVRVCSDKAATFRVLAERGIPVPRTEPACAPGAIDRVGAPCVIKPATGSGGSAMVFLAGDADEAAVYAEYITRSGGMPIAQEYVPDDEGEFTVGVLSLPSGAVAGSIALRRALDAKLSVASRTRTGVISSGYSQGYVADFAPIRQQCERIAAALGSTGPLNVQGRVRGGVLIPFEVNPRLSASTFLRALAGFNETDLLLQGMAGRPVPAPSPVREGWYLRSLTEMYVPPEARP